MDVRIEAAAAEMAVQMMTSVVRKVKRWAIKAITPLVAVASFPRPISINGHSISAVAPDYIRNGGTAVAF